MAYPRVDVGSAEEVTIDDAVAAAARYRSAEPRAATDGMIALVTLAPFVLCLSAGAARDRSRLISGHAARTVAA